MDESNFKTKSEQETFDLQLKAAIQHSLEVDQNFKLYSYRLISAEAFVKNAINNAEGLKYSFTVAEGETLDDTKAIM